MNKSIPNETKTFYAELNSGIGGSSVPIIIGDEAALKWNSPYKLYQTYIGQLERTPPEKFSPAWMGTFQEPSLLSLLQIDTGFEVVHPFEKHTDPILGFDTTMLRDSEFMFAICHLDGWAWSPKSTVKEPRFIVEAKNLGEFRAKEFGKPFTDEVPDAIIYQCQHNLKVARSACMRMKIPPVEQCLVPVMIGGNKYHTYLINWHPDLWANLVGIEETFWDCVVNKIPPPIDGGVATAAFIKQKYAKADKGLSVAADEATIGWIKKYNKAKRIIASAETELTEAENNIRAFIGNASELTHNGDTLFTWNNSAPSVSWKDVAEAMFETIKEYLQLNDEQAKSTLNNYVEANRGAASRRFSAKDRFLNLIGEE